MSGLSPVLLLFGSMGMVEWVIIGLIVLVLFGSRLPRAARGFGQSIKEFKKGIKEGSEPDRDERLTEGDAEERRIARERGEKSDASSRDRDSGRGY
jgi:sec-independent protein translocase protein TatA